MRSFVAFMVLLCGSAATAGDTITIRVETVPTVVAPLAVQPSTVLAPAVPIMSVPIVQTSPMVMAPQWTYGRVGAFGWRRGWRVRWTLMPAVIR